MKNILGWFAYRGITTLQHESVVDAFRALFDKVKPSQILEIGTSQGGLTAIVSDILNDLSLNQSKIRTYDIDQSALNTLHEYINEGRSIDIVTKNIFNHQEESLLSTEVEDISKYIQQDGVTVVLCDGGYKKGEFKILSKYLKPGDIIMAHDYSPDTNFFKENIENQIWNWMEISDLDIEESVSKYNLEPYMHDTFTKVVWVCKRKAN